jgi:hypothetical protein
MNRASSAHLQYLGIQERPQKNAKRDVMRLDHVQHIERLTQVIDLACAQGPK